MGLCAAINYHALKA